MSNAAVYAAYCNTASTASGINRKKLSPALAHFAARALSLLEVRLVQSGSLLELVVQGSASSLCKPSILGSEMLTARVPGLRTNTSDIW